MSKSIHERIELAAIAHALNLGDVTPPRPDIYKEVKVILNAFMDGDRPWVVDQIRVDKLDISTDFYGLPEELTRLFQEFIIVQVYPEVGLDS